MCRMGIGFPDHTRGDQAVFRYSKQRQGEREGKGKKDVSKKGSS